MKLVWLALYHIQNKHSFHSTLCSTLALLHFLFSLINECNKNLCVFRKKLGSNLVRSNWSDINRYTLNFNPFLKHNHETYLIFNSHLLPLNSFCFNKSVFIVKIQSLLQHFSKVWISLAIVLHNTLLYL